MTPSGAAEQASGDELCMDNLFPGNLNCTSNDVAISGVAINPSTSKDWIEIKDDGCAYPGDTVDFDAVFEVFTNAVERFDVGVYFAIVAVVGAFALVRNPDLGAGELVFVWLFANGAGTLLLAAFLTRRVRAVGPLVLAFMASW